MTQINVRNKMLLCFLLGVAVSTANCRQRQPAPSKPQAIITLDQAGKQAMVYSRGNYLFFGHCHAQMPANVNNCKIDLGYVEMSHLTSKLKERTVLVREIKTLEALLKRKDPNVSKDQIKFYRQQLALYSTELDLVEKITAKKKFTLLTKEEKTYLYEELLRDRQRAARKVTFVESTLNLIDFDYKLHLIHLSDPTKAIDLDLPHSRILTAYLNQAGNGCLLTAEHRVYCRKIDLTDYRGDTKEMDRWTEIVFPNKTPRKIFTDPSGRDYCASTESGALFCWGNSGIRRFGSQRQGLQDPNNSNRFELLTANPFFKNVEEIVMSRGSVCSLRRDGIVQCGHDDNNFRSLRDPVRLGGEILKGVRKIAGELGYNVSTFCGIDDREAYCWDDNKAARSYGSGFRELFSSGEAVYGVSYEGRVKSLTRGDNQKPLIEAFATVAPTHSVAIAENYGCVVSAHHVLRCFTNDGSPLKIVR